MSLELQQAFGLRREEAMKFQPSFVDPGDHLRARRLAGFGSLIPNNRNYVHKLRVYEGNTLRAGRKVSH